MIVYFLVLIISCGSIFLGLLSKRKYDNFVYYALIFCGLLFPCIIAALRDTSVGSDTDFYILGLFEQVSSFSSPLSYIEGMMQFWQISDLGYLLTTYVVGKMFNNFNVLLFFMELLIVFPVYKSIENNTGKCSNIIYGMLLFFLFWYNVTFNMLRQSLALAFSMLGISYMNKNNIKYSILFSLIAVSFHKSALISILIISLIYISNYAKINEEIKNKLYRLIIIISLFVVSSLLVFVPVANYFNFFELSLFENIHVFEYFKSYKFDFSFIDTFIYFYVLILILLGKKSIQKFNINYSVYKTLSVVSIVLLQIGMIIPYGERISFYFIYPLVITIIPISLDRKLFKNSLIIKILTFFVFFGYWILIFLILGVHNTVPYVFFWK